MLQPIAPGIWDLNAPLSVLGMHLGHRMTIVRLANGSLWVHSPVAHDSALAAELAVLGPVAHVVAPNAMHDTYLEGWFAAYPRARFHGAKGFSRYRPDLKFTDTLNDHADAAWSEIMDQKVIQGAPRLNEVVFLHRPSRTLILTDLIFNLGPEMPLLSRVLLKANGCFDCVACSRLLRTTIKNRAAFRTSLDTVLAWDFDRVVLSHGRNLESGGRTALREAFLFLPSS